MNFVFMQTVMLVLASPVCVPVVKAVITSVLRDSALSVAKPVKVVCVTKIREDASNVPRVST